ncbi:Granule-bound starch synthase 1, chloroplastic/amyloplastic [Linum perenne]
MVLISHCVPCSLQMSAINTNNEHVSFFHGSRRLNNFNVAKLRSNTTRRRCRVGATRTSSVIRCEGGGMRLVFVGAEVAPWSKTGGLGDVLGGLPVAMAAKGHRVMTISPRYDQYKDAWDTGVEIEVKILDTTEKARFFHCYKRGVDRVFVDHPLFLARVWGDTGRQIYGPVAGTDYEDNQLRFSLFCQAALEAPRLLNCNSTKSFEGPYGNKDKEHSIRFIQNLFPDNSSYWDATVYNRMRNESCFLKV